MEGYGHMHVWLEFQICNTEFLGISLITFNDSKVVLSYEHNGGGGRERERENSFLFEEPLEKRNSENRFNI